MNKGVGEQDRRTRSAGTQPAGRAVAGQKPGKPVVLQEFGRRPPGRGPLRRPGLSPVLRGAGSFVIGRIPGEFTLLEVVVLFNS